MANENLVAMLLRERDKWEVWKETNPDIRVDLSSADLRYSNLSQSNLCGVNLEGANLKGANLYKANLRWASLVSANLTNASLAKAHLGKADLSSAILKNTSLNGSSCLETIFVKANLKNAVFRSSKLSGANFSQSNLKGVDFRQANLNFIKLLDANITGTKLFGTARDNWEIEGIKCDYIFWDPEGKVQTPKEKYFRNKEFEELYKNLPTIEYFFENGFTPIDPVLMDRVVKAINEKHPDLELRLDSFHSRSQPHAVFTVLHKDAAKKASDQVKTGYENQIKILEGKREQLLEVIQILSKNPKSLEVIAGKIFLDGDNYEIRGQAGAVGPGAHAHEINFNHAWNDISKNIDLAKLSGDLSILKEAIKREAISSEQYHVLAEVSDAEKAAKAGNGPKVLKHLKKAGKWTFDVARDIGTDVAAEVIKKSMEL